MATDRTKTRYVILSTLASEDHCAFSITKMAPEISTNLFGDDCFGKPFNGTQEYIDEIRDLGFIERVGYGVYRLTEEGNQHRLDMWERFIRPELTAKHVRSAPVPAI